MTPLEEVELLLGRATEACQFRTVISRAYYASYRRLTGIFGPLGFAPTGPTAPGARHIGVHARLREFAAGSAVHVLRKIGLQLLPDLYRLRIKADYSFNTPVTRHEATEAVAIATDIEDWLTDSSLKTHIT